MIENAIQIICVYAIPLIFAITLHEAAHGWAAKKLGDDTAWILGRVTANPVPHIDPVGTVLVPGALVLMSALTGGAGFVFGWAKPVPINPRNFRNIVKDTMLVSFAGPATNFLLSIGFAVLLRLLQNAADKAQHGVGFLLPHVPDRRGREYRPRLAEPDAHPAP